MSVMKPLLALGIVFLPAFAVAEPGSPMHNVEFFRQVVRPTDLIAAAKGLSASAQAICKELSKPADRLILSDNSVLLVQPTPRFLGAKPILANGLEVEVIGEQASVQKVVNEIASYLPYERFATEKIAAFLGTDGKPGIDHLAAADLAFRAVLRFHHGSRVTAAVGHDPWQDVRGQIEERFSKVRGQLFARIVADAIQASSVPATMPLADFMLESHPKDMAIRAQVRRLWVAEAMETHKKQDWLRLRNQLRRLDDEFVHVAEAEPLRQAIRAHAELRMKEGLAAADDSAMPKLQQAFFLWPRLPGVRDAIAARQKSPTVVYVAARSLPVFLSPATAWTDSEKQVVELLFESLVEFDATGNPGAGLGETVMDLRSSYRGFDLRRDAYWSDGSRVVPADVRHTVQLLRRGDLPGRIGLHTDAFDVPRVNAESFTIDFNMRQWSFDALAPFHFKVLPEHYHGQVLTRADDPKFAKAPTGSGPFVVGGTETQAGRPYVVFKANPNYVRRAELGRPFVREIRMFAWQTPADLTALPHPVHLVLGIPTEHLDAITKIKGLAIHSAASTRVQFLAVNHRKGPLAETSLRRAIAHAIHREKLLTDHFRGGQARIPGLEAFGAAVAIGALNRKQGPAEFHWPVSGPYPKKSWAACPPPRVPANPFDPGLAKTLTRQALKPGTTIELSLKYPADDPAIAGACKEMAQEIEALGKGAEAAIKVKLIALGPRQMKAAIDFRDFDLAYHHFDPVGASFDVWPLFDPSLDAVRPGGSNYLGYDSDAILQSLLRSAHSHRSFAALQEATHNIHAHLYERMPLIPLWQLHSHWAVDSALTTGPIDPLLALSNAVEWKLQR